MELVVYANTECNGAGDSVIVQTAQEQAVQLGDVSAFQEHWRLEAALPEYELTEQEDSRGAGGGGITKSSAWGD